MQQQNKSILSVMGSSRSDGHTKLVTEYFSNMNGGEILDLNSQNISYYDYEHQNRDDDFLNLIRSFVANNDVLVLVTPIYWYTMSAQMKTFLDRISDLLTIEKDLGRQLRGKSMALISQTEGDHVNSWFAEPFSLTAKYLGMEFKGHAHVSIEEGQITEASGKRLEDLFHSIG
ncbi:MAG: NAD(P)H-dependent oxidoreductase [Reichenbachiella sp.]|uniref:flavodoxin family protein n=1 Tax=Reichenbachiella sp. TaxID=2184521 RepID=UPI0032645E3F